MELTNMSTSLIKRLRDPYIPTRTDLRDTVLLAADRIELLEIRIADLEDKIERIGETMEIV